MGIVVCSFMERGALSAYILDKEICMVHILPLEAPPLSGIWTLEGSWSVFLFQRGLFAHSK